MFRERPKCIVEGCEHYGQHLGRYRVDGSPYYRKTCVKHHSIKYAMGGWVYKINRKSYCENIDGRLGFVCTSTIIDPAWQLDVDHIDGDPSNNDPSNHQTLCKCCHPIKTRDERDHMTLGRKSLGIKA
jgi:hypothetical protein